MLWLLVTLAMGMFFNDLYVRINDVVTVGPVDESKVQQVKDQLQHTTLELSDNAGITHIMPQPTDDVMSLEEFHKTIPEQWLTF